MNLKGCTSIIQDLKIECLIDCSWFCHPLDFQGELQITVQLLKRERRIEHHKVVYYKNK